MILTLGGTSGSSATAYRSSTPSHLQQQRGGINLTSLSVQKVQPFCLEKMLLIKWSSFWNSCYKIWLILAGGGYYYNNSYYRTGRSKSAHGGTRTKQVRKTVTGINFTNVLRASIACAHSKSAKRHWWLDCLSALLGSVSAYKTLVKLTLVDNHIIFFLANKEFFRFFAAKLCHFIKNDFFLYVTNTEAEQQK